MLARLLALVALGAGTWLLLEPREPDDTEPEPEPAPDPEPQPDPAPEPEVTAADLEELREDYLAQLEAAREEMKLAAGPEDREALEAEVAELRDRVEELRERPEDPPEPDEPQADPPTEETEDHGED